MGECYVTRHSLLLQAHLGRLFYWLPQLMVSLISLRGLSPEESNGAYSFGTPIS
jgi:hypothetical protein